MNAKSITSKITAYIKPTQPTVIIWLVALALIALMGPAKAMPRENEPRHPAGVMPVEPPYPKTVSPNGDTVIGADIYHGDTVDFKALRAAGASFVFIKATEGATIIDPHFEANWAAADSNGFIRGAYCFFHAKQDAELQARKFLAVLPPLHRGDLVVLDLETPNEWTDLAQQKRIDSVIKWITIVESELYMKPIIYCSRSFPGTVLGSDAALGNYPLWLAEYNVPKPTVPPPWTTLTLWQWTETGTIGGLTGNGNDLDAFNGTPNQLDSLADQLRIEHAKQLLRQRRK